MKQQFFTTQVQEVSVTRAEIDKIVIENLAIRSSMSKYDFDHTKPVIIYMPCGGMKIRFLQSSMLVDGGISDISLQPLEKYKVN